jgi:hypothetical protein
MPLILPANTLDSSFNIDNSLRFNDGDTTYLTRTHGASGSTRTFTFSCWVKFSDTKSGSSAAECCHGLFASEEETNHQFFISTDEGILRVADYQDGSYNLHLKTNALFRDYAAWYHICIIFDTTDGTEGDRCKVYVNGVRHTSFSTAVYPSVNTDLYGNGNQAHFIGRRGGTNTMYFDGYMADVNFIDGTAAAHTEFGETNDNGVWIPKEYEGSYGTNGFHLEYKNINPILGDAVGRHKISPSNGATFNTSVKKFGGSSLYLDNTNNFLDVIGVNRGDFGFGACNSNNFTIEFWCYKLANSSSGSDFIVYGDNNSFVVNYRPADPQFKVTVGGTEYSFGNNSPALSNTTWTHIAVVNEGGTLKIYKDGTVDATTHDISGKTVSAPNNLYIGYSDADTFDGYIDELRISNTARYTGNFSVATSQFDVDSNTKLLLHMDADHSIGTDSSGQANHFTSYNFTLNDQCTDTPTNNFCTINPLQNGYPSSYLVTLSEGNTAATETGGNWIPFDSTIAVQNGKWYWECKNVSGSPTDGFMFGIQSQDGDDITGLFSTDNRYMGYYSGRTGFSYDADGNYRYNGSSTGTGAVTYTTGDIIMLALDMDNGFLYVGKNGTWNNSGDPTSAGSGTGNVYSGFSGKTISPCNALNGSSVVAHYNFGNPPFEIASGNSDANGYGTFEYAVPSGYYALCTKNLAEYG